MSNNLLTIAMITQESLRVLSNTLTFTGKVNRQYDDQFAKSGAKIGQTVSIRKPAQYTVNQGPVINIQAQNETYTQLTLNRQWNVGLAFTSAEKTMSLDMYSDRVIKPAVIAIANQIDYEGMQLLRQVYNQTGTAGTAITKTTANDAALDAGVALDNSLAPRDGMRSLIVSPKYSGLLVSNNISTFNPSGVIGDQYTRGSMTTALGFDIAMDQNCPSFTNGTFAGSPVTTTTASMSASSVAVTGFTSSSVALVGGEIFTIAGVYSVNAQNKQSTGVLQNFVVAAPVTDTAGAATISFYPAIVTDGGAQNVVVVGAGSGKALTFSGASGANTVFSAAFHRDAFVFGCADLEVPGGVNQAFVARDPDLGLSVRVAEAWDVRTDQFITRLDILGGWATLYPQLACRIATV